MNEIIQNIKEVYEFKLSTDESYLYEGFEIETDRQKIYVLVSDESQCCEHWGHLSTPDELSGYIGSELTTVEVVDTALEKNYWDSKVSSLDEGGVMFINFNTNRGTFQLTVYNAHNGYYGHRAKLISEQRSQEVSL